MNYPDANHLLWKNDRKAVARVIEWEAFRTLSDSEVSLSVRITEVYFRSGNYGKCDVLSDALSGIMYVSGMKVLKTSCRNV
jgi:hypothetical protein